MTCSERERTIQAYLDGELDLTATLEIEGHIATCATCQGVLGASRAVKQAAGRRSLVYAAPDGFEAKVMDALLQNVPEIHDLTAAQRPPAPSRSTTTWISIASFAAAACVAIALYFVPLSARNAANQSLEDQVVSSHIRSLMASHLFDVASTDQHTVKPWFDGKVDFSPLVTDYTAQGFPLIGGRLDYIDNRPVAAVVYRHRKHIINMFVWPDTSPSTAPIREPDRQGYHVVHWIQAGMSLWAVSDMNGHDLLGFARLVQATS